MGDHFAQATIQAGSVPGGAFSGQGAFCNVAIGDVPRTALHGGEGLGNRLNASEGWGSAAATI